MRQIPPQKSTCHLKRDHFKRKIVFLPSFFRGYVSFRREYRLVKEGRHSCFVQPISKEEEAWMTEDDMADEVH